MPDDIDELERKADSRLDTYHFITTISLSILMVIIWLTIYQLDTDPESFEYSWGVPVGFIVIISAMFLFGVAHKRPLTGFWISAESLVFWRGIKQLYAAGPLTILVVYGIFVMSDTPEYNKTPVCFILLLIIACVSAITLGLIGKRLDERTRKQLGARNRFYRKASVTEVSRMVESALAELGIDYSIEERKVSGNPSVVFTLADRPIKLRVSLEEKWDWMVLIAMSGDFGKHPEEVPRWRGIEIAIHKLSGNMGM